MSVVDPLSALLRKNPRAFVHKTAATLNPGNVFADNWHLHAVAYRLEQCRRGQIKRLIITMPPRSLKSIMTSVALPAYILGHAPTARIICASYADGLALKHADDFRTIMCADWYRRAFPGVTVVRDTRDECVTSNGGVRRATSVGGVLTGLGGDYLIIDDPLKPDEAASETARERVNRWYRETAYTRLDDKQNGVVIVVMQRLHEDDLVGYLLQQGGWTHLNLPAIAPHDESVPIADDEVHNRKEGEPLHPAREPLSVLEETERNLGSTAFQAQYQQSPMPASGIMIKSHWLKWYDTLPPRSECRIVQSWDTAMKGNPANDYSVCTTWHFHQGSHYLVDAVRIRCDYPALRNLAVREYGKQGPSAVIIEDQGSGTALIKDLQSIHRLPTVGWRSKNNKITRLSIVAPLIEAGKVLLPRDRPWLPEFQRELLGFPQTKYDDQVDSLSQYLGWARDRDAAIFNVFWT